MKKIFLFILFIVATNIYSQTKVSGTISDSNTQLVVPNANIININNIKGTRTNGSGFFEINAIANDTLHISIIGYQSIKVKVTNDWIKNSTTKIKLTPSAIALEEVIVRPYNLTGFLEIDSKLIPLHENYRYSISGLNSAYEGGDNSPNAFGRLMGSIFNPADMLYNFFGSKPRELRKLKEMHKDDTVKNLLESKFDRETIAVLLGIDKKEIAEILSRCSYSETFIRTANDLQILDAISECYEEYKILKKK